MKALILANSGNYHFFKGECIPTCFLPLHGGLTIIQRIFSLLSVSGFSQDDICICFGTGAAWDSNSVKKSMAAIQMKKIYSPTDTLNRRMFEDDFFNSEDLLVLSGSDVIDLAIITRLLRYREKNVIVVKDMLSPDDTDKFISASDETVREIVDPENAAYPWIGYAGVCKLSKEFVAELNSRLIIPLSFLDAISLTLDSLTLKIVNYDDLGYGIIRRGHSNELIGGSYSKLNYRLVVKKEAEGAGRAKLINEIDWLLNIPEDLKPYFSSVLEYNITGPKVYYNVPYYGSRNLREYIFAGNFDVDDTIAFLDKLLHWMFDHVYCRKISAAPENWTVEKHINRVLDRLEECCGKSKALKGLIEADKVVINGVEYRNVRKLYEKISRMDDFIKKVNPTDMVMIHGDLHFQNILLSNETDTGFILVDPRGEHQGSDVYYDMGKLFHSIHGKYDFIHSDQIRLNLEYVNGVPNATYTFTNEYMVTEYDKIYEKFLKLIAGLDYMKNDPDWMMKCLWAEASHFCSVMTFHVAKSTTPDRVILLYLMGVILINEFYDGYIMGEQWKKNDK